MKLTPADFEGSWQISRQITDFRIMESGTLEGEVTFTPHSQVCFTQSVARCALLGALRWRLSAAVSGLYRHGRIRGLC